MPQQLAGIAHVGSSSKSAEFVTVRFSTPFTAPPAVVVSVMVNEVDQHWVRFGIEVMSVQKDQFMVEVSMLNGHAGWGRDVSVCWIAAEVT